MVEHGGSAAGPAIIRKNPAGGLSLNFLQVGLYVFDYKYKGPIVPGMNILKLGIYQATIGYRFNILGVFI